MEYVQNKGEAEKDGTQPGASVVPSVAFLLPSNRSPLAVSELLHAAAESGAYAGCLFVLLLDRDDPTLAGYIETTENLAADGRLSCGGLIFDGTPYAGKVNKAAMSVAAEHFCVIDPYHLPRPGEGGMADLIDVWAGCCAPQDMRVGCFGEVGAYPVVSRRVVERLGYLFHPLCYGRVEAEWWLGSLADALGILSRIEGRVFESKIKNVDAEGWSSEEDGAWVRGVLEQLNDEEAGRLERFVIK
jgi:hypothetical protein